MIGHPASENFAFGRFEVNSASGELLKDGVPIRLSSQPFRILLLLLAHPGEVVTREQLRDQIWGEGTFVDFDHSLNAAVNKLRRALNDSADDPRFIETLPGRGYRFVGTLKEGEPSAPPAGTPVPPARRPVGRGVRLTVACAAAAVAALAAWLASRPPGFEAPWKLTRLTFDEGLSGFPAISRDGKLLAYSAESGENGERDLFVRQISGGLPVRVTADGVENTTPDFSPDGTKIVYRSSRAGGGIYQIPVLGGEARLLAKQGLNPRYSPDGSQVAYWVGAPAVAAAVPGSGQVWVVPASGGAPRGVTPSFTASRQPVWSPDGEYLLFVGYTAAKAFDASAIDWWLVARSGGEAKRTGLYETLVRAGLQTRESGPGISNQIPFVPAPACWRPRGGVVFAIRSGETQNLWEIDLSPMSGSVTGPPRRLTTGAGNEVQPACGPGETLAFTSLQRTAGLWIRPFDLNRGLPSGPFERISRGPIDHFYVSLSRDGRHAAYGAESGQSSIWLRDLDSRKETNVAGSPSLHRYPVVSPSGTRVLYSVYEREKRVVYLTAPGGAPEKLCEGCLRATDWSRDEKSVLIFGGDPYQISSIDLATRVRTELLKHPRYHLLYGHYSPDNRWMAFTARTRPGGSRIFLAPLSGPKPVPESAWLPVAEGELQDWAHWSPDGRTLYFMSSRDGRFCLWGQRLDLAASRLEGAAFPAQHLHGRAEYQQAGWTAAGSRIAMVLFEQTGNVWMMTRGSSPAPR